MPELLTKEQFDKLPAGRRFAYGIFEGFLKGKNDAYDGDVKWVAVKGEIGDWAIYYHHPIYFLSYIEDNGDKMTLKHNILHCVPCDEEVFKNYRY